MAPTNRHDESLAMRGSVRGATSYRFERCRRKRSAASGLSPSRAVGVDFGCAWLTLERVRVLGLRADVDAAVTTSACDDDPGLLESDA